MARDPQRQNYLRAPMTAPAGLLRRRRRRPQQRLGPPSWPGKALPGTCVSCRRGLLHEGRRKQRQRQQPQPHQLLPRSPRAVRPPPTLASCCQPCSWQTSRPPKRLSFHPPAHLAARRRHALPPPAPGRARSPSPAWRSRQQWQQAWQRVSRMPSQPQSKLQQEQLWLRPRAHQTVQAAKSQRKQRRSLHLRWDRPQPLLTPALQGPLELSLRQL